MDVKIVIGANAGDEGKGLMTDYFCRDAAKKGMSCVVVLHNGGPQRGHTVVYPNMGIRHVFRHFGSGTFAGASTHLDKEFIVNPMVFADEWDELRDVLCWPTVFVHPKCRITTPYDMMLNQIMEEQRAKRHGSCGMGIYETIKRYERRPFLRFGELSKLSGREIETEFLRIRSDIREIFVEREITLSKEWAELFYSPTMLQVYANDLLFMIHHTKEAECVTSDRIVFEGGQGLLLDQNNWEDFPHLTPSNTGLDNPVDYLSRNKLSPEDIEVCYVTRTYMTRHGAGPMDHECSKDEIGKDVHDQTNVPNPFQGSLRYGLINPTKLLERVRKDFLKISERDNVKKSIAITHMNEHVLPRPLPYYFDRTYLSEKEDEVSDPFTPPLFRPYMQMEYEL